MAYRLGIDIGGTFADFALLSNDGELRTFKVPTRSEDLAGGCLAGLAEFLADQAVEPSAILYWAHGTTVAMNAILERKGARTALLVTEGFRDVLQIRRQLKPDRYDLHRAKPESLVPRSRCLEIRERVLFDGTVRVPLDREHLERQVARLDAEGVEAVAICLLHSYANHQHEDEVRELVRQMLPVAYITVSHEVLPEFREYPRAATTVANAYVGPSLSRYLGRFAEGGREMGIESPLTVFQSNGGITPATGADRLAVNMLYSGPAAGVEGAAYVAGVTGHERAISFDMGGTSCDVCLIQGGRPMLAQEKEVAGFPIRSTRVDVHSIGAGGGSIAWMNAGGLLEVGPDSAGSNPGPAAYGRGGARPTVTDANVVLGRLNGRALLDGRLSIDLDAARAAIGGLARRLGLTPEETALAILRVVNTNMIGAIRVVSVERGVDYRDCVLIAFGGAGPLHAVEVAREMGFRRVIVPLAPGILCALGLLLADYRRDFTRTRMLTVGRETWKEIAGTFADLERQARSWAQGQSIPLDSSEVFRYAYLRHRGQSHELRVTAPAIRQASHVDELLETFHKTHTSAYGYSDPNAQVQITNFHVAFVSRLPRPPTVSLHKRRSTHLSDALVARRDVWLQATSGPVLAPVLRRELIPAGSTIHGPAIIEQLDSTTVVPAETQANVDEHGNLIISLT